MALTLLCTGSVFGQATSITSTGFRASEGGGGALSTQWVTGNLGNTWSEGEWVPYQLIISNVQTNYPNLNNFPNIVMSYDFTGGGDKRFVDLVRSIQAGTAQLTNAQGWPQDAGTAYPMATRAQIENAQNDFGNTGDLENIWPSFANLDLPDSQMNRFHLNDSTFTDGTVTDAEHAFYITKQDLLDAGVPTSANTIIIYYQLHESRTFVWQNSLQEQYDQPQTDGWGGYLYSLPAYAADVRQGAGFVPGSSGHIEVEFASGSKTVPIPIPEQLPGSVSGLKWLDTNGNGVQDGGEPTLSGWEVHASGMLEGISFSASTLTDGSGDYSFPTLTSGTVWTIKEDAQRDVPAEIGYMQTYPLVGTVLGQGTGAAVFPPPPGVADVGWDVLLTLAVPNQADMNFGNKFCQISCTGPPDLILSCTENTDPAVTGVPTVTSNCAPVDTVFSESIEGTCPTVISRRWIFTDAAGMADTCEQTITIVDETAPLISGVGSDETIECPAVPSFSNPVASDSCDPDPSLTFEDVTTPGACPQEYSVTRTWTATDDCGNFSTASQTITVEDNTPPVLSGQGADATIECPATPVFTPPTASDLCDNDVPVNFSDVTTPGACPQEYSITRTWTAVDDCGNQATAVSQTITVEDNTPPVLSGQGADATIECPATPVFTPPTASDLCDNDVPVNFSDVTTPGACPQEYSITRTWTAVDDCGNQATPVSQTFTVIDDTPPVISGVGSDATIECPAVPQFSNPSASDLCDPNPGLTFADVTSPGACPQEYSVTRTWTATDECGNSSTASQTITVEDNTPPVLSGQGADATIECPATPVFTPPTASDLCDNDVPVNFSDVTTPGACPQEYSITRTWTAVDDCGNQATPVSQTITVEDNTPPVITCPVDVTFNCNSGSSGEATAVDACDPDPVITFTDEVISTTCPAIVNRTWVATDACGNSSSCVQVITVVDNDPPSITCPNPVTVQCIADVPAPNIGDVTASDNCGIVDVTFEGDVPAGTCPTIITRTYKATDACGNFNTCTQIITVDDTIAPVLTGCPDDASYQCYADVPGPANVTADDNCDGPVTPVFSENQSNPSSSCNNVITRKWVATDVCGNVDSCVQVITVNDDIAPVLTACPADFEICPDVPVNFTEPAANDNCDGIVPVVCSRSDGLGFNEAYPVGITTITCRAFDVCGNGDSCSFTVTVNDNPACSIIEGPGFGAPICAGSAIAIEDLFCGPDGMSSYSWSVTCGSIDGATDSQCVSWIPPDVGDLCWFYLVVVDSNGCNSSCSISVAVPNPAPCGQLQPPDPLPNCGSTGNVYCVGESFTITDVTVSCADWNIVSWDSNCFVYDAGNSAGPCTFIIDANDVNGCPTSCTIEFECVPQEEFCSFTIGGWGTDCPASQAGDPSSTQPGCIRDHFFAAVFPAGVTIGDAGGFTASWATSADVNAFLPNGSTPGVLNQNYVNPTSTSAGVLAAQILALTLNVEYSCAGVFSSLGLPDGCYADLVIPDTCGSKFAGLTVDSFLVLANKFVSGQTVMFNGKALKAGDVNVTATCLNQLNNNCSPPLLQVLVAADPALENVLPTEFGLDQNYPNPFNPSTEISFSLPKATNVKLEIFNLLGQKVVTLVDGAKEAGIYSVTWNGSNVSSGVYFYRLTTPEFVMSKKMLLMK